MIKHESKKLVIVSNDLSSEFSHRCGRHLLDVKAFSSATLNEICRFILRLLFQEIRGVTAIRNQQDIILCKKRGKSQHGIKPYTITRDIYQHGGG